jgi:hypothetical protein
MNSTVDPILAIAILVNIAKPAIALKIRPSSAGSDSLIRGLAILLGILGELIACALTRSLTSANLNDALGRGFGHGVLAILLYHLVTSPGPENANHAATPAAQMSAPGAS